MKREEAIKRLNALCGKFLFDEYDNPVNFEQYEKAIHMAIEALQTEPTKAVPPSLADVYKWERDIALSQLEEYGIGFAEKKRDDLVEVVRCKDCRHRCKEPIYSEADVHWVIYQIGDCPIVCKTVSDDDYCSHGERREE